jgi:transcriptional regulator GlxA family with amidase domain
MTDHPADAAVPPRAAMLLYPGLTLLDLIGPHTALAPVMEVHLVWRTRDPVSSDTGVTVLPTTTLADCPPDVDVLFVPGGRDQASAADEDILTFLADRGSRARYVTAVCGGSLILGAAGLLRGYRAATHWTGRDALALVGAENVDDRVVIDRNRITGGGVTAGLDFALTLLAQMFGDDVARMAQLAMEYDPQPPFDCGSPEKAGPVLTELVRATTRQTRDDMIRTLTELNGRGWGRERHFAGAG